MAETFSDVVSKFDMATEELASTLDGPFESEKVPFRDAYCKFADKYMDMMREVQEHGMQLSGNVQAGAIAISSTDSRAAADYGELGVGPEQQEVLAAENQAYVNRHLNSHIDQRYGTEEQEGEVLPTDNYQKYLDGEITFMEFMEEGGLAGN